ncbi:MAG: 6-phosphogluconolactonase [Pseudomonadota bacterium]
MGFDPSLIAFASRTAAAERLADYLEAQLGRAIAERGSASIAVSGGSTPEALYRKLAGRSLDWARVTAILVDERWVSPGEAGSNETFVRRTLQSGKAGSLKLIGLWSPAPSPGEGLRAAETRLEQIEGPFDAVVLGMGNDGHTASWFPDCEGLDDALSIAGSRLAAVRAKKSSVTGDHLDRMTLTLGAVASARAICLVIAGEDKRAAFEHASAGGNVADMPVRAILRMRPDLWACWAP